MRQSNLELCRIVSILLVVLVHANYAWQGWPTDINTCSIPSLYTEAFAIIGVNVFVMLTGYFSAKPKLPSLINLTYICLFYAIVRLSFGFFNDDLVETEVLYITKSNWFIVSYLILLFIAPILNTYVESVSKCKLEGVILALFIFETYYGWFPALCQVNPGYGYGYSVLSFIKLYLIARYIRLNGLPFIFKKYSLVVYIICSILIGSMAYFQLSKGLHTNLSTLSYGYNNPIVLLASIAFFSFFENLKIGNQKWINYIAQSCLAVLLLHGSYSTAGWMKAYFGDTYNSYDGVILIPIWFAGLLMVLFYSVAVDQIRIYSYKTLSEKLFNTKIYNSINNKFTKYIG